MSAEYSIEQLKIATAKILRATGYHSVKVTTLDVIVDVMARFLFDMGKKTNDYANFVGQSEPNLDHLGMVLKDFNIDISDLEHFVLNNKCPSPNKVPKYPVAKKD